MRIGSLFSGYGGLDIGVRLALGGDVVWHAEIDKNACKILAHHWPDVANLGDVTSIDWATVPTVDVLTGGFPCQDVSHAGLRRGLSEGTRSGLWSVMAQAVDALRPSLVVIENVRGLLSAKAHSNVESCPWCLGEEDSQPPLRALGAVLGDLAELGYDARWISVRASDIGACHRRERVFIIAYSANTGGRQQPWPSLGDDELLIIGERQSKSHSNSDHFGREWNEIGGKFRASERIGMEAELEGNCLDPATDASGQRYGRRENARMVGRVGATADERGRATGTAWEVSSDRGSEDAPDTVGEGLQRYSNRRGSTQTGGHGHFVSSVDPLTNADSWGWDEGIFQPGDISEEEGEGSAAIPDRHRSNRPPSLVQWGPYEVAIRRWEHILGRPAPDPTEPGNNDRPRLSATFVEWMMGLPYGWVTAPEIGLLRSAQLKALGNGVVPQQAAYALSLLLNRQH